MVAVIRQDKVVVPRGDTEFYEGDEVLMLVTGDADQSVQRLFIAD